MKTCINTMTMKGRLAASQLIQHEYLINFKQITKWCHFSVSTLLSALMGVCPSYSALGYGQNGHVMRFQERTKRRFLNPHLVRGVTNHNY